MPVWAQAGTKPVQIIGMGMHHGGNVIYRYQIKNKGNEPIKRIILGFANEQNTSGQIGLTEVPFDPSLTTIDQWFPPTLVGRPEGWGARLITEAGNGAEVGLEWIEGNYVKALWPGAPLKENAPTIDPMSKAITPGQVIEAFTVTVPKADFTYTTGNALVTYGALQLSIPIEKGDTLAPALNLNVVRINQNESNGNWAIFHVQASAKDNYDPSPTLLFEPVTSNQALQDGDVAIDAKHGTWKVKLKNIPGRTYQFRFSSQDASGNTAVKTFDYSVAASSKTGG